MTEAKREIDYVKDGVDKHPDVNIATAPDEEEVLRKIYGNPDADGIYRREAQ